MITIKEVQERLNKKYGDGAVVPGGKVVRDVPRIPTGVFAVDFTTGGGFPIWRTVCLWGPPSAGKSTLALLAMAGASRICWKCFKYKAMCKCKKPLYKKSAYIDVEGTVDASWANSVGVNDKDYFYLSPDTGEDAVNMADNIIQADDCGLIVVDSLAMLEPSVELDASAEDMQVGLQARLVAKMFRKITARVIQARKDGRTVSAIFINQVRAKIGGAGGGFAHGPQESQPAGYAARFAYSLSMRIGSRYINPSKEPNKFDSHGKPLVVKSSVKINKHKVMALALAGEYEIVRSVYGNYPPGTILDYATTLNAAKEYGLFTKQGSKYILKKSLDDENGAEYKTQKALIEKLRASPTGFRIFKMLVIDEAKRVEIEAAKREVENGNGGDLYFTDVENKCV